MFDLFDILSGSEGGQAYITVAADDAMDGVGLISATGSEGKGATTRGMVIAWKADGGLTGGHGWTLNGKTITYVPGNIELTNQNVANAVVNKSDATWVMNNLGDCWDYR